MIARNRDPNLSSSISGMGEKNTDTNLFCVSAANNWRKHGQTCTSEPPSEIWASVVSPSPSPNSSSRLPLQMLLTCISTFFICLNAPSLRNNRLFSVGLKKQAVSFFDLIYATTGGYLSAFLVLLEDAPELSPAG